MARAAIAELRPRVTVSAAPRDASKVSQKTVQRCRRWKPGSSKKAGVLALFSARRRVAPAGARASEVRGAESPGVSSPPRGRRNDCASSPPSSLRRHGASVRRTAGPVCADAPSAAAWRPSTGRARLATTRRPVAPRTRRRDTELLARWPGHGRRGRLPFAFAARAARTSWDRTSAWLASCARRALPARGCMCARHFSAPYASGLRAPVETFQKFRARSARDAVRCCEGSALSSSSPSFWHGPRRHCQPRPRP